MNTNAPSNGTAPAGYEVFTYKPYRAGLPNLQDYFRSMWIRRELAIEISRSELRAQQATTVLGQFWLILNPLMMALVYYTLVVIISGNKNHGPDFLSHLLSGLFIYNFATQCLSQGANSVVSVGKLITNRAFPRLLLPISSILVAVRRFIPTLLVYLIFHAATGQSWDFRQFAALPALLLLIGFVTGAAALLASLQVYFRDIKSILPYATRLLMYISPVLYYPDALLSKLSFIQWLNPFYSLITCWSEALVKGEVSPIGIWVTAASWSVGVLLIGCYVFISREREFAVRI